MKKSYEIQIKDSDLILIALSAFILNALTFVHNFNDFNMKMNNLAKEVEIFGYGSETNFNPTVREATTSPKIDPKLMEAYLMKGMATFDSRDRKPPTYTITICLSSSNYINFQMATFPCVGDEVTLLHKSGREQVHKIVKVRHHAYQSQIDLDRAAHASATIWVELVTNPLKIGVIN